MIETDGGDHPYGDFDRTRKGTVKKFKSTMVKPDHELSESQQRLVTEPIGEDRFEEIEEADYDSMEDLSEDLHRDYDCWSSSEELDFVNDLYNSNDAG